jgi:hypothetical protein
MLRTRYPSASAWGQAVSQEGDTVTTAHETLVETVKLKPAASPVGRTGVK